MGSLVQIQSPRPFFSSIISRASMSVVVLTNDDGIHAPGLAALESALAELGEVYVVAPEREQSACGHALTLHRPPPPPPAPAARRAPVLGERHAVRLREPRRARLPARAACAGGVRHQPRRQSG